MTALKDKHPSESLPDAETCEKIAEVFDKISSAHRANAEVPEGLAELSTEVHHVINGCSNAHNPDRHHWETSIASNSPTPSTAAGI